MKQLYDWKIQNFQPAVVVSRSFVYDSGLARLSLTCLADCSVLDQLARKDDVNSSFRAE